MGLAAVPFGTAQADNHTISVKQEEKSDAVHFKISVFGGGIQLRETEIVWLHDSDYPTPLLYSDALMRCYNDEAKRETRINSGGWFHTDHIMRQCSTFFEKWRNFYDVKKFNEQQLRKVASPLSISDATLRSYSVEFLKNKNIARDTFFQRWRKFEADKCYMTDFPGSDAYSCYIVKWHLPKGCTVAHYFNGFIDFYIFKDKQRSLSGPMYTLVLKYQSAYGSCCCLSDIPTVGFGGVHDYRSNNEILSPSFRERILSTLAYEEFFWGRCFMYRGGCKSNADVYAEKLRLGVKI